MENDSNSLKKIPDSLEITEEDARRARFADPKNHLSQKPIDDEKKDWAHTALYSDVTLDQRAALPIAFWNEKRGFGFILVNPQEYERTTGIPVPNPGKLPSEEDGRVRVFFHVSRLVQVDGMKADPYAYPEKGGRLTKIGINWTAEKGPAVAIAVYLSPQELTARQKRLEQAYRRKLEIEERKKEALNFVASYVPEAEEICRRYGGRIIVGDGFLKILKNEQGIYEPVVLYYKSYNLPQQDITDPEEQISKAMAKQRQYDEEIEGVFANRRPGWYRVRRFTLYEDDFPACDHYFKIENGRLLFPMVTIVRENIFVFTEPSRIQTRIDEGDDVRTNAPVYMSNVVSIVTDKKRRIVPEEKIPSQVKTAFDEYNTTSPLPE